MHRAIILASYNEAREEIGKGCLTLQKEKTLEIATQTSPNTLLHRNDLPETHLRKVASQPMHEIQKCFKRTRRRFNLTPTGSKKVRILHQNIGQCWPMLG